VPLGGNRIFIEAFGRIRSQTWLFSGLCVLIATLSQICLFLTPPLQWGLGGLSVLISILSAALRIRAIDRRDASQWGLLRPLPFLAALAAAALSGPVGPVSAFRAGRSRRLVLFGAALLPLGAGVLRIAMFMFFGKNGGGFLVQAAAWLSAAAVVHACYRRARPDVEVPSWRRDAGPRFPDSDVRRDPAR
jgi:hypothetical protein